MSNTGTSRKIISLNKGTSTSRIEYDEDGCRVAYPDTLCSEEIYPKRNDTGLFKRDLSKVSLEKYYDDDDEYDDEYDDEDEDDEYDEDDDEYDEDEDDEDDDDDEYDDEDEDEEASLSLLDILEDLCPHPSIIGKVLYYAFTLFLALCVLAQMPNIVAWLVRLGQNGGWL